jgi:hypothetical protein
MTFGAGKTIEQDLDMRAEALWKSLQKDNTARLLHPTGEAVALQPENGKDFQLKELQTLVGGLIEPVGLDGRYIMVINEEGMFKSLERNHLADLFYCQVAKCKVEDLHGFLGNVVVMPEGMLK